MAASIPADALVLLVGAAASGKSTWAAARFRPTQIVSSDTFRELVADDAADQGATRVAFQLLHLVAGARLERGLLTVIDATNLTSRARRPLLALAERYGRPAVAVVFDVPLDVLRERNAARGRTVGEDVLFRHVQQLRASLGQLPTEGYVGLIDGADPAPIVVTDR